MRVHANVYLRHVYIPPKSALSPETWPHCYCEILFTLTKWAFRFCTFFSFIFRKRLLCRVQISILYYVSYVRVISRAQCSRNGLTIRPVIQIWIFLFYISLAFMDLFSPHSGCFDGSDKWKSSSDISRLSNGWRGFSNPAIYSWLDKLNVLWAQINVIGLTCY